ncbi:MAG: response regulator [Bacilli bacterium]|jgi:DNA-binding LytR/AlgR family response regulator|nr:response regulator [Bacilli bacterium]
MDILNIAIYEDDIKTQKKIGNIVSEYYSETEVNVYYFVDGNSFLESVSINRYSIVFMDIDLKNSNGIEVAKKFRNTIYRPVPVIFITGYDNYQMSAIETHAFGLVDKYTVSSSSYIFAKFFKEKK